MNTAAACDGLLAVVSLWVALHGARDWPGARLGALILACAAVLGTLRFSEVLPLPALHQFVSALGAGVSLPLLAIAVIWPRGEVSTQARYAWIFTVVTAALTVLMVVVAEIKLWAPVLSMLSVVAMAGYGLVRRQYLALGAGVFFFLAFVAFAARLQWSGLQAGDLLHLGMSTAMVLLGLWLQQAPSGQTARD